MHYFAKRTEGSCLLAAMQMICGICNYVVIWHLHAPSGRGHEHASLPRWIKKINIKLHRLLKAAVDTIAKGKQELHTQVHVM